MNFYPLHWLYPFLIPLFGLVWHCCRIQECSARDTCSKTVGRTWGLQGRVTLWPGSLLQFLCCTTKYSHLGWMSHNMKPWMEYNILNFKILLDAISYFFKAPNSTEMTIVIAINHPEARAHQCQSRHNRGNQDQPPSKGLPTDPIPRISSHSWAMPYGSLLWAHGS